jgi:hypothetical protein
MAALYGQDNGNYQHGGYSVAPATDDVVLARLELRRILTAKCDDLGRTVGVSPAQQAWALRIYQDCPWWAKDVLASITGDTQ